MAFFLIFFFTAAPLLILYASGFRYDVKRGRLLRTGNIFIEAPSIRRAQVYINDELFKESLTNRVFVKNILPNEYSVRIEKEDRYTWEKRVLVHPGLTTFLQGIILFAQSTPLSLFETQLSSFETSPTNEYAIYTQTEAGVSEVYLFSMSTNSSELIGRFETQEEFSITWSSRGRYTLLKKADATYLYDTKNKVLKEITHQDALTWNKLNESLIEIAPHTITTIDPQTLEKTLLYTAPQDSTITDVLGVSDNYFILLSYTTEVRLIQYNKNLGDSARIDTLPVSTGYRFTDITDRQVAITNTNNDTLYVIKRPSSEVGNVLEQTRLQFSAKHAEFAKDGSKILFYNDFELNYFDFQSRQIHLINRFSTPIHEATWYPSMQHVLLSLDNRILVTDIGSLNQSQLIELSSFDTLTSVTLVDEETLLISGSFEEAWGVFSLTIN
jgi:hypothetical protein